MTLHNSQHWNRLAPLDTRVSHGSEGKPRGTEANRTGWPAAPLDAGAPRGTPVGRSPRGTVTLRDICKPQCDAKRMNFTGDLKMGHWTHREGEQRDNARLPDHGTHWSKTGSIGHRRARRGQEEYPMGYMGYSGFTNHGERGLARRCRTQKAWSERRVDVGCWMADGGWREGGGHRITLDTGVSLLGPRGPFSTHDPRLRFGSVGPPRCTPQSLTVSAHARNFARASGHATHGMNTEHAKRHSIPPSHLDTHLQPLMLALHMELWLIRLLVVNTLLSLALYCNFHASLCLANLCKYQRFGVQML